MLEREKCNLHFQVYVSVYFHQIGINWIPCQKITSDSEWNSMFGFLIKTKFTNSLTWLTMPVIINWLFVRSLQQVALIYYVNPLSVPALCKIKSKNSKKK